MDRIEPTASVNTTGAIGEELDRLEVTAGKIGLNSAGQSLAFLHALDAVYQQVQSLKEDSPSRRQADTQLEIILARLRADAGQFLRDLGGPQALRQAREQTRPPQEHVWWYIDTWLAEKRRASLRRTLSMAGITALVLVLLGVLYQNFLAPDPQFAALYGHEQSARDQMMSGDLQQAMEEVDQGLVISPDDPTLRILKGVILEAQGQPDLSVQHYAVAEQGSISREDFLITRGQAYAQVNLPEKGLADAQEAIQLNPDSAQAYLLSGQVHEMLQQFNEAMTDYDQAFEAANRSDQPQLAALARTRTAMLFQMMNNQITPPSFFSTETP